jgi:ribosomal protein S18 acetylase RimI-like enzyme
VTGFIDGPGAFVDDFLQLEAAASEPYCRFAYASDDLTRAVQQTLLDRGVGEYAPPSGRLYLQDDSPAGMIACLTGAQLQRARLAAALALAKVHLFDPRAARRIQLAGTTLLKPQPTDFYLSRIAVHPRHRNQGVGARLLDQVLAEAARANATQCVLEVAPEAGAAIALYRRYGFDERDRRRVEDPESGRSLEYIHMARSL